MTRAFRNDISLLVIVLAASATTLAAEVHKWTDSEGRVHYGDAPVGHESAIVPIEKAPPPDKFLEERRQEQDEYVESLERERAARKLDKELRKKFEDMKDALRGGPARR
ncbi:MAG: DUF4124 domain-containing protein [Bacteroidota bacterium]